MWSAFDTVDSKFPDTGRGETRPVGCPQSDIQSVVGSLNCQFTETRLSLGAKEKAGSKEFKTVLKILHP